MGVCAPHGAPGAAGRPPRADAGCRTVVPRRPRDPEMGECAGVCATRAGTAGQAVRVINLNMCTYYVRVKIITKV